MDGTGCSTSTERFRPQAGHTRRVPGSQGVRLRRPVIVHAVPAASWAAQCGDGGRVVPSTSRRATTRSLVDGAGEDSRRLSRGPPTSARAVGLRQVDGTALSRQGDGRRDGNGDGNPSPQARSRLNGHGRLTSATTATTSAALHLESKCMPLAGRAASLRDHGRSVASRRLGIERNPCPSLQSSTLMIVINLRDKARSIHIRPPGSVRWRVVGPSDVGIRCGPGVANPVKVGGHSTRPSSRRAWRRSRRDATISYSCSRRSEPTVRMSTVRLVLALTLASCMVASCGIFGDDRVTPHGSISFQPSFLPIIFSIDSSGKFSVSFKGKIVTQLGVIQYNGSLATQDSEPLTPTPRDSTQLVICASVGDGSRCEGYQINSGRRMRIDQSGQFTQFIEGNRIRIDAAPAQLSRSLTSGLPPP